MLIYKKKGFSIIAKICGKRVEENSKKKIYAKIGDIILVVVETYILKRGFFLDEKKKDRFVKGKKHKVLVTNYKKKGVRLFYSLLIEKESLFFFNLN